MPCRAVVSFPATCNLNSFSNILLLWLTYHFFVTATWCRGGLNLLERAEPVNIEWPCNRISHTQISFSPLNQVLSLSRVVLWFGLSRHAVLPGCLSTVNVIRSNLSVPSWGFFQKIQVKCLVRIVGGNLSSSWHAIYSPWPFIYDSFSSVSSYFVWKQRLYVCRKVSQLVIYVWQHTGPDRY